MPTIRELRERRGWSQRHLAKEIGVSSQAVLYWESGAKTPTVVHLRALSRVLGRAWIRSRCPKLDTRRPPTDGADRP